MNVITPERLAKTWNIGLEAAKRTCESTTQKGVRRSYTLPSANCSGPMIDILGIGV
jgi:hypothetical protein